MAEDTFAAEVKAALGTGYRAIVDLGPPDRASEPAAWRSPTLVFVTSPALGPASLAPTVAAMADRGHEVAQVELSDLVDLPRPRWRSAAGRIAATVYAAGAPVVLVGHGQAGPLLAPVADLRRVIGLVLIDTALPPVQGEVPTVPYGLAEALADRVVDGRLPPWETWWPQCALEFLVDDEVLRQRLRSEQPRLPAGYAREQVAVGGRWASLPAGYLRLSLDRESEATFAGVRGMAVERLAANHLATATAPDAVAARLAALLAMMEPAMI